MNFKKKDFETGDILLYHSTCWYSKLIEFFTGSQYSHCSMILRDPVYIDPSLMGLFVIESSAGEICEDSESNHNIFGVQIIPLDKVLQEYSIKSNGNLYFRKLKCLRDSNFIQKITEVHHLVHHKPYDLCPIDWINGLFKIDSHVHNINTFWCSALLGYIYSYIGLLPASVPWSLISPGQFSSDSKILKFQNGTLSKDVYLDCVELMKE